MRRILFAVALGLTALVTATVVGTADAPAGGPPTYLDQKAPINARVNDLLGRMTLEEKVGQMDQIVIGKLRDTNPPANGDCNNSGGNNDPLQTSCLQRTLIDYKTGSILSGGTDNPADNTGHGWAEQYNTIQHYAIERSRLHIPVIYGVDAVHGFGHPYQATLFPQSIGMGATWDTDLAQAAGAATREQLLATGGNWDFAPVQDLARDNRWGRYYETWAEEPELSAAMGGANIRGLQGGGFELRARRHHAHDLALDHTLGGARVLHLLAHRDFEAARDKLAQMHLQRVVREAGQWHAQVFAHRLRGQRDLELFRHQHGVVIERLVEIAEAEEDDGIGVTALHLEVLAPDRGRALHQGEGLQGWPGGVRTFALV